MTASRIVRLAMMLCLLPEVRVHDWLEISANQIERIEEFQEGAWPDPGGDVATATFTYDLNGNLIFDGSYWYQYDAWNRLLQIHPAGALEADDFEADGALKETAPEPDDWIVRHIYDAMGRLMRKRMPHPGDASKKVTENYYYDGVRRIQTSITWPTQNGWPAGTAWQEYVYGPDYVDEFVAFVDDPLGSGVGTYYTLQDANYNVMALLRASSSNGGPAPLSASNVVVWQAQYSPYGLPLVAETITANLPSAVTATQAAAACRMGHQGLFFERYDAGADQAGLTTDAEGTYYNRARFYGPEIGRFLQADVNGTGLPATSTTYAGLSLTAGLTHFSEDDLFRDGANLYAYVDANPVVRTDPQGLFGLGDLYSSTTTAMYSGMAWMETHGTAVQLIGNVLIMANLYAMMNDPEYLAIATSMPNGWAMLNYDLHQLAKFGTSLAGAARAAASSMQLAARVRQGGAALSRLGMPPGALLSGKVFLHPDDAVIGFVQDGRVIVWGGLGSNHELLASNNNLLLSGGTLRPGVTGFVAAKDPTDGVIQVFPSGTFPAPIGGIAQAVRDFFE